MARKGTTKLNLGTWSDKENPGAGSQDVDNTALNGNWIKLDTSLGAGHNADVTHKNAIIDAANLKSSVADGLTLVQDSGTKKLKVNSSGIGTTQLADGCVTTAKIADDAVTTAKLATSAVTTNELADSAVATAKIQDSAVTEAKIADGAITSAKLASGAAAGSGYMIFNDMRLAALTPGSSAAIVSEWEETSATPTVKFSALVHPRPGDKYLKLIAHAKTLNSKGWRVELNYGGTAVTATGFNTSYDVMTHEVILQIDISSISSPDTVVEAQVKLSVINITNSAYMTDVVLMVTPN
ncbi:MAG: hypothetical protein ACHQQQ_00040 [Bacteroidota bacterium]